MIIVVLPAFNEDKALVPLMDKLCRVFKEHSLEGRVIIVNDGSTDATSQIAKNIHTLPVQLVEHETNKGLSEAIKTGLLAAVEGAQDHDTIITMDADNTHSPGLIMRMTLLVEEGNDIVIASRYVPGARVIGLSKKRELCSILASWLFRLLFPMPNVKDYTCGYRAYRASLLKDAFRHWKEDLIDTPGFSSMVGLLLRLRDLNAIAMEVPLILRYDVKPGSSKMNVSDTIKQTLVLIWRRLLEAKSGNDAKIPSP